MGRLFISYRRDDTQDITNHVYEKLAARFGAANIFMDVDSIPIGADFRKILREAVAGCDVALVMIGRQWLLVKDGNGARRLDNPNDFVRIEVEAALARNIPVVPVLTQGVAMARESDLPSSMGELAYRHGVEVRSGQHFSGDVEQLIKRLAPLLSAAAVVPQPVAPRPAAPPPPRYPLPDVPTRLASLDFQGVNPSGTPAIVPPLITIPAGPFLMGSDKAKDSQAYDDELPQHRVEVAAFQIAKYPVTVAEYALAVRAGKVREPTASLIGVTWAEQQQHPDHPVVYVSWQDAVAYIAWLIRRDRPARLAAAHRGRVGEGRALGSAREHQPHLPLGRQLRQGPLQHPRERHRDHQPGRLLPGQRRAPQRGQSIRSGGDGGQCVGVDRQCVQALSVHYE